MQYSTIKQCNDTKHNIKKSRKYLKQTQQVKTILLALQMCCQGRVQKQNKIKCRKLIRAVATGESIVLLGSKFMADACTYTVPPPSANITAHPLCCLCTVTFTKRVNIIFRISLVSEYTSLIPLWLNPCFLFLLFLCSFFLSLFFFFFFSNSFFLLLFLSLCLFFLFSLLFSLLFIVCLFLSPLACSLLSFFPPTFFFLPPLHLLPFFLFHLHSRITG